MNPCPLLGGPLAKVGVEVGFKGVFLAVCDSAVCGDTVAEKTTRKEPFARCGNMNTVLGFVLYGL